MKKDQLRVLGIMSGTSLDGVDAVFVKAKRSAKKKVANFEFKKHFEFSFSAPLRRKLLSAAQGDMNIRALSDLHFELGQFYANRVKKALARTSIDLVGLHGQTVYHNYPQSTLQIGEPSFLMKALKAPVVHQFRNAELAFGGQGAPLATMFHRDVLATQFPKKKVAVQNLGGIGNVSYFGSRQPMSFDTGPANMICDSLCEKLYGRAYDRGGKIAASGIAEPKLLNAMMKDRFVLAKPPKSCGREEYGLSFLKKFEKRLDKLRAEDQLATAIEFSVESIAWNYRKYLKPLPDICILAGGGALNSYFVERLKYRVPEVSFVKSSELGWGEKTIEGAAFALLACYRYWGWPSNIPYTTGASQELSLGAIVSPLGY